MGLKGRNGKRNTPIRCFLSPKYVNAVAALCYAALWVVTDRLIPCPFRPDWEMPSCCCSIVVLSPRCILKRVFPLSTMALAHFCFRFSKKRRRRSKMRKWFCYRKLNLRTSERGDTEKKKEKVPGAWVFFFPGARDSRGLIIAPGLRSSSPKAQKVHFFEDLCSPAFWPFPWRAAAPVRKSEGKTVNPPEPLFSSRLRRN